MDTAALMPGTTSGQDSLPVAVKEGILAAPLPRDYGGFSLGHSLLYSGRRQKIPFMFDIVIVLALGSWPTRPWPSLNPWICCGHFAFIFFYFQIEDWK